MSYSEFVSYLIGILGILTSVITYLRSKRIQEPKFKKISSVITEEMISKGSNVHIQNGDERLGKLTITKIAFWNEGITLNREEISTKSPFRIEEIKEESKILEAYVSYAEEENDVTCDISEDAKQVRINFDYLAKEQGFVLKILHTGLGSSALAVKGSMKNNGRLRSSGSFHMKMNALMFRLIPLRKLDVIMGYSFMIIGLVLTFKGVFSYGKFIEAHYVSTWNVAVSVCTGVFVASMGYLLQKEKMPEKVSKAFFDEL